MPSSPLPRVMKAALVDKAKDDFPFPSVSFMDNFDCTSFVQEKISRDNCGM